MSARIGVVGGGLIGLAIAEELSRKAMDVTLFEPGEMGAASSKAAGILGAQFESHVEGAFADELVRARDAYADWLRMLGGEVALSLVDFRASGVIRVAEDEEAAARLREIVRWQLRRGLRAELLDATALRDLEPALAISPHGGAWFPDDAQLDPPLLVALLGRTLLARGVKTVRSRVRLVEEGRNGPELELDDGTRAPFDEIVVANGAWGARFEAVRLLLPELAPFRGQMLRLAPQKASFHAVVERGGIYALARTNGVVDVGATIEQVGFETGTTAEGIASLERGVREMVPALAAAPIVETWAGLRPFARAPLVARARRGLIVALGHYRNGILLAHSTAQRVEALLGSAKH